jgi:hypothetical protein
LFLSEVDSSCQEIQTLLSAALPPVFQNISIGMISILGKPDGTGLTGVILQYVLVHVHIANRVLVPSLP